MHIGLELAGGLGQAKVDSQLGVLNVNFLRKLFSAHDFFIFIFTCIPLGYNSYLSVWFYGAQWCR